MNMRMLRLLLILALSGPAAAGEMTRGLEIQGGKNAFTALRLTRVEGSEEGLLELKVDARGARELRGYGFVLGFDPQHYEFVEARESDENLLETGSGAPRLFLAASSTPGQVAVGSMLVDGRAGKGDGGLVSFRFRTARDPQPGDFQLYDAVLVDLAGNVDAVGKVEIGSLKPTPAGFGLEQNMPNPFNPATSITYQLPEHGRVKLVVYNVLGQEVRTLVDDVMDAGVYTARWDGRDGLGRRVASGIYVYRMSAGGFRQVRRMTLLK